MFFSRLNIKVPLTSYRSCRIYASMFYSTMTFFSYKNVKSHKGEPKSTFLPSSLAFVCVEHPRFFPNLTQACKTISAEIRRHTNAEKRFVQEAIHFLSEGVIELSSPPWRVQVPVLANENHKKRVVVDYNQTIS
uniref:Retrovirus-related Pol polyprotein from transposon opus n=1 Tax=Schistocephalus solidus TaxID=70667 RepID=A0A0V0J601_SCHSO